MMVWIQILVIAGLAMGTLCVLAKCLATAFQHVNPDDVSIEQFADEVFTKGVYVLACGGGVIAEPRWAVYTLTRRYGSERLLKLALQLIREKSFGKEFREGVVWSAEGIVYHLGDRHTLDELIKLRRIVLEAEGPYAYVGKTTHDMLIAALAEKLELPVPEGVERLEERVIKSVYCIGDF